MDKTARKLFDRAFASKAWPAVEESLKEKKGPWLSRNWWLLALLGAAARLEMKFLGVVYLNGSYSSFGFAGIRQRTTSIAVGKPIGLGSLNFSWNSLIGPAFSLSVPIYLN